MNDPPVSKRLLQQRVRNGIIDYLELAASADKQRDYERRVPIAQVPSEMIVQWEDWIRADDLDWLSPPVFSHEENHAIRRFHLVWEAVADETPDPMPHSIETLIGTEVWARLMAAARIASEVFSKRGRFDDDVEQRFDN